MQTQSVMYDNLYYALRLHDDSIIGVLHTIFQTLIQQIVLRECT